jgi:hypothetical protein
MTLFTRCVIHSGPDRQGRYQYTLFWMADYHPGHPDGEHRLAERGQVFLGVPPHHVPLSRDAWLGTWRGEARLGRARQGMARTGRAEAR